KEYEKRKMLAQERAAKEISEERRKEENERFMGQVNRDLKLAEQAALAEGATTTRGQAKIIENDSSFKLSENDQIGFEYEIIEKKKYTLGNDKSELNGIFMLYEETKKLEADGIINFKRDF